MEYKDEVAKLFATKIMEQMEEALQLVCNRDGEVCTKNPVF